MKNGLTKAGPAGPVPPLEGEDKEDTCKMERS